MVSLSNILDEDLLIDLAGNTYFERGVGYFNRGLVRSLAQYGDRITAEVMGTETYQIQLWLENNALQSRCTCPLGVDDLFCKHCVAVGLAWIAKPPAYQPEGDVPKPAGTTMQDVHDYLAHQDHEVLVQMILDRVMDDARWRDQLLLKAASQNDGGADITTFRRSLQKAIAVGYFVEYGEAAAYADTIQSVVDSLEDLLDDGYASDVVELCAEAIALFEDALNSIDDSNGYMSSITEQIQELHYRACDIARPNPRALAQRLFQTELSSGYDFFYNALDTYADMLGDEGLDTYRRLIEAEWDQLPKLTSQDDYRLDSRRSNLGRMKEKLVATTGSFEDLVAVMSKDLSTPSRYLQIARLYKDHGNTNEAIAWAEQGFKTFADSYRTGQVGDFLITEYEQLGRFDDALEIVWQNFARSPSLHLYQQLNEQAEKSDAWATSRERAIAHIRDQYDAPQPRSSYGRFASMDYSMLVEIFLWEGDVEQAWQDAQAGGCSKKLWMRLAEIRQETHPSDALSIYQPAIEPLINQSNNEAYANAVDLLLKVQSLMKRLDQQSDFDQFLGFLKTTYKRKRNFMSLLKNRGLVQ